ncbi:hypothetical protein KIPB_012483, partial [Kipferlia bialata]
HSAPASTPMPTEGETGTIGHGVIQETLLLQRSHIRRFSADVISLSLSVSLSHPRFSADVLSVSSLAMLINTTGPQPALFYALCSGVVDAYSTSCSSVRRGLQGQKYTVTSIFSQALAPFSFATKVNVYNHVNMYS